MPLGKKFKFQSYMIVRVFIIACMPVCFSNGIWVGGQAISLLLLLIFSWFSCLLLIFSMFSCLLLLFSMFSLIVTMREKPSPLLHNKWEKCVMLNGGYVLCQCTAIGHLSENIFSIFSPFSLGFLSVSRSPKHLRVFSLSPNFLKVFLPSHYVRRFFSYRRSGAGVIIPRRTHIAKVSCSSSIPCTWFIHCAGETNRHFSSRRRFTGCSRSWEALEGLVQSLTMVG